MVFALTIVPFQYCPSAQAKSAYRENDYREVQRKM
jgi:hypothetical protein